ncbi:hypothetical protein IJC60_02350 [bacterium]|nr:hypothetical protein [bacterium]
MEIKSKTIKFEKQGEITLDYIKKIFKEQNIDPLRWAITEIKDDVCEIALSYID